MTAEAAKTAKIPEAAGYSSQHAPLRSEIVGSSANSGGPEPDWEPPAVNTNTRLIHRATPFRLASILRMTTVMKVAVPVWNGRVSPVFDVAEHFCVFDVRDRAIKDVSNQSLANNSRVVTLWKLGVDVVICGGISHQLEAGLWVAGIEVIRDICGPVGRVIDAYVRGVLAEGTYFSPCHANRHSEVRSFPRRR